MDLEEVIKKRRSVKIYQRKKISNKLVKKILKLANLSPSAGNIQARSVIIVQDRKTIESIPKASYYYQDWIAGAPIVFIICANITESAERYSNRGRNLYAVQDATIFASYLQLIATSFSLSTRWVGAFDEEKIREIFDIPKEKRPIIILPLGYPRKMPEAKERKSLKEIVIKEI